MTVSGLIRQLVRKRASYLCEYCHSPEKISTRFLHALLLSQLTLDRRVVPLQSGSSLPRVTASDVLSVKLPIPNLDKQKKIGDEIEKRRSEWLF